ncbi:ABC transporter permease [Catenuloplanes atrovinosus]|uniref:Transport permease protein n=1 Tax=Catenuloplanes atrovinosus TaxID=137266 RepID=A0AAE4C9B2_9ACTN|nr:ABC transporter permease [Catenuloplanes atrovinosus]MDR7275592.1 ABC-2 type transport system permease protein [Catenuloplanes atrovinosus]
MIAALRVLLIGGMTSYRALFNWLTPWILIPTFFVTPLVQILLFAYVGRVARVGDDTYYLIGNAVQYAAIPCLFAMGRTISGERRQGTLGILLASPAPRVPLFLGRALPVIVNGAVVCAVALGLGALLLGVRIPLDGLPLLAVAIVVCAFSCTGLGLLTAAVALRVREASVLSNLVFGVLLIFAGVNVPIASLPGWMSAVSGWLPLTHGIDAARRAAAGASAGPVGELLVQEAALGAGYALAGLALLAWLERESRRMATLEVM